jgi:hypothetical protein
MYDVCHQLQHAEMPEISFFLYVRDLISVIVREVNYCGCIDLKACELFQGSNEQDRNDLLYTDLTDEQQHPTKSWSRTW